MKIYTTRTEMLLFATGGLLFVIGLAGIVRLIRDITGWNSNVLLGIVLLISITVTLGALIKSQFSALMVRLSIESEQRRGELAAKLDAKRDKVYFILDEVNNVVKIGVSCNPFKRLSDLQTATHAKLSLLVVKLGSYQMEGELHRRFADDRINGEWFRFSDSIKEYLNG